MAEYTEPTASSSGDNAAQEKPSSYPSYKRWCRRIEAARKLRKDWARTYKVEKCEQFYLGQQRPEGTEGLRVLNHFLANIRVTQPNLLFENPKFLVRPKPGKVPGVSDREARITPGVFTAPPRFWEPGRPPGGAAGPRRAGPVAGDVAGAGSKRW